MARVRVRKAIDGIATATGGRDDWCRGVTDGPVVIEYSELIASEESILDDQEPGAGERPRRRQ